MANLIETAQTFVSIGGRVWTGPGGRLGAIMDADSVFATDLSDEEVERRDGTSRAFFVAKAADPAGVAALVREYGQPQGRFIVWEAA